MTDLQFIPHTKRRKMSKARAVRIFLARNGMCCNCHQQIRPGQSWFIEHPDSLAQGGSDDDDDLWPSHESCKPAKDAIDAAQKAKRDRIVAAEWTGKTTRKWPSRPFGGGHRPNIKQLDENWSDK